MAFAALALIALGILLIALLLRDAFSGRTDLVSLRTVFFASFALFQIVSGLRVMLSGEFGDWTLTRPGATATMFAAACWVFMLIFLGVYAHGFLVKHLARALPGENASPSAASLLLLAAVVLGSGIVFKTMLIRVPVFGPMSDKIGGGQLALCVGLAVWAWAPRLLNPVIAAYAGAIILTAIAASLVGTYGRRDLVSVLAIAPWAMYHAWWKHGGIGFATKRLAIAAGAGVLVIAAYSSIRSHRLTNAGIGTVMKGMAGADLKEGLLDITHGQFSANISMWIIETRPEGYPYDTLHSLRFGGTMIVPRQYYPDKPMGLGITIPTQIHLRGRGGGFSVGPGIIGHAFNDNPWIALWLYPLLLGLALRFVDEAMRSRPYSPFIILPAGAGLGELTGIARGELGLFAFNASAAMAAAYMSMIAVRMLLGWFGWRPNFEVAAHDDPHAAPDQYDDYTDTDTDSQAPARVA